ncbi:MAG TPA: UbiA family prenyltransferase [bacterium]
MKNLLKPLDYFFVMRPVQFYAVWAVFLAGFFVQNKFGVAATSVGVNHNAADVNEANLLWVGLGLTLLMAAVFVVHQVMARDNDTKDKANLVAQGNVTPRRALIESAILLVAGLTIGFVVSLKIGLLFLVLLFLTGLLYNFKPFRWKDKPLLSLTSSVLGALLIFGAGWIIRGAINFDTAIHALPYLCFVAALFSYTRLAEITDEEFRKKSPAQKNEFQYTIYFGLTLQVAATVAGFLLKDEMIFYTAFFAIPFFGWAAAKMKMQDLHRAVGYSILLITLAVLIKFQVENGSLILFGVMAALYVTCRLYYRFRFGLDYPRIGA